MPTEPLIDHLPDGRTVFVSQGRERVLVYASYEDIRSGAREHRYEITPAQIRMQAEKRGEVIGLYVIIESAKIDQRTMPAWVGAGFQIIPKLPDEVSVKDNVTLVRAPAIQNPIHAYIGNAVKHLNPDMILFVATNEIPPAVFYFLRQEGVKIETLNPKRSGGQSSRLADKVEFLGDALKKTDAPKEVVPCTESVRTVFVDSQQSSERAIELLARRDPETFNEIGDILSVKDEDVQKQLRRFWAQFKNDDMSMTMLAVLLTLASIPEGDDERLDYNDLLLRFILNGIDCREVGQMVLDILVKEGTLAAVPRGTGMDYLYLRDPDDPTHRLARRFYGELLRSRSATRRRGKTSFAACAIQAAEIFMVCTTNMPPEAHFDFREWIKKDAGKTSPAERKKAYATLGISYREGVAMDQTILDILNAPYDVIDQEDPEADEPPASHATQRDVG